MQNLLRVVTIWLFLCGVAAAQLPPVQSINTNQGVACNAIGSQGPVTKCLPGWTYGCQANQGGQQLLATDGQRTSIQFQNTGATATTLTFGDNAIVINGFQVQPGNSYLWSNIGRGNEPGRVATGAVSIIAASGTNSCVFMFTD